MLTLVVVVYSSTKSVMLKAKLGLNKHSMVSVVVVPSSAHAYLRLTSTCVGEATTPHLTTEAASTGGLVGGEGNWFTTETMAYKELVLKGETQPSVRGEGVIGLQHRDNGTYNACEGRRWGKRREERGEKDWTTRV